MSKNLVISVLGHRNAGKSTTWEYLFGYKVRRGYKIRKLYLNQHDYVEVFLVNGSCEETGIYIGDMLGELRPRIILCSMQYVAAVNTTIDFFIDNDYSFYTQWLNPGHHDIFDAERTDYLGIIARMLSLHSTVSIRSGKKPVENRGMEIVDFLYGWSRSRGLIMSDSQ
ncbi:hypothetical protein JMG10_21510 [Nostoc ellipsosporum NOK]|nr:hypothetical protein [Nostoc ellipsosporum NOK]